MIFIEKLYKINFQSFIIELWFEFVITVIYFYLNIYIYRYIFTFNS